MSERIHAGNINDFTLHAVSFSLSVLVPNLSGDRSSILTDVSSVNITVLIIHYLS